MKTIYPLVLIAALLSNSCLATDTNELKVEQSAESIETNSNKVFRELLAAMSIGALKAKEKSCNSVSLNTSGIYEDNPQQECMVKHRAEVVKIYKSCLEAEMLNSEFCKEVREQYNVAGYRK